MINSSNESVSGLPYRPHQGSYALEVRKPYDVLSQYVIWSYLWVPLSRKVLKRLFPTTLERYLKIM
jgi:hypothetical protein